MGEGQGHGDGDGERSSRSSISGAELTSIRAPGTLEPSSSVIACAAVPPCPSLAAHATWKARKGSGSSWGEGFG